ncbi:MAG: hypothetical protein OXC71_06695 [Chloroflexi bacterium]|nr:hypothetical protein [Chloroflexota bacterium]
MRRIAVLSAVTLLLAARTLEPEIVEVEKIVEVPTPAALPASCSILIETAVSTGAGLVDSYLLNVDHIRTAVEHLTETGRLMAAINVRRLSPTEAEDLAGVFYSYVDVWTVQEKVMAKIADVEEFRYSAVMLCKADLIGQGTWSEPSE